MATIVEGDRVRFITREATDEDLKSAMYFNHYGGLIGSVLKVYGPTEVAIEVEQSSLTKEVRKRHEDVRDQMKTKWLDGLSEEGRGKLTERERDFFLRYIILVSMVDLEKIAALPTAQADAAPVIAQASSAPAAKTAAIEAPRRKTLAELEAAEAEELARHQKP